MEENRKLADPTPMFTSSRPELNKYKYFIFIDIEGNGSEIDCDILIDHKMTNNGELILVFEGNEYVVHKMWRTIDYGYNKPQ